RLRRHLGAGGEVPRRVDVGEHGDQVRHREQGGGSAADEDGGDGAVGHAGAGEDVGGEVDLAQGGVGVLCLARPTAELGGGVGVEVDRKSTRLNSSHVKISYAVFCLKKKKTQ